MEGKTEGFKTTVLLSYDSVFITILFLLLVVLRQTSYLTRVYDKVFNKRIFSFLPSFPHASHGKRG